MQRARRRALETQRAVRVAAALEEIRRTRSATSAAGAPAGRSLVPPRAANPPVAVAAGAARLRIRAATPGDLFTASARKDAILQVHTPEGTPRIKKQKLGQAFVPRGLDYDPERGLLALAAVSRVLLYEVASGSLQELTAPTGLAESFAFANDVLFDGQGHLLVADHGVEATAREPRDGHVWQYDLNTGGFLEIANRRPLRNPTLLARDADGQIYVVDRAAGDRVTPRLEFFYDIVYRIDGVKRLRVKVVYDGPGVQATAFAAGPDGRFWLASVDELALLAGDTLERPCEVPRPFAFITGLVPYDSNRAWALDGEPGDKRRTLRDVDDRCTGTEVSTSGKLKEARGLVAVAGS